MVAHAATDGHRAKWIEVTKREPCPICEHDGWCKRSADGNTIICRRQADGAEQTRTDKNGAPYHVHRLGGQAADGSADGPKLADADTRHRVYARLLELSPLSSAHRRQLKKRGLSDDEIAARGYGSLAMPGRSAKARELLLRFGRDLDHVPGFITTRKRGRTIAGAAGLLVPVRDTQGRVVALKIRRDKAGDGPRYVTLSSARYGGPSPGAVVHCPIGAPADAETCRVTEGELKADISQARTGTATLSVPGAINWRPALPILRERKARRVLVALDADSRTNPHVAAALRDLVATLRRDGYGVALENWDAADGKGIDDLLAQGKTPRVVSGDELQAMLESAGQVAAAATGKPTIVVDTDEMRVVDEAIAALADDPRVFQRSGELVHIVTDAEPPRGVNCPPKAPRIRTLPEPRLRELLAAAALWVRESEGVTSPCHVPLWAVKAVAARPTWPGIRPLTAVVETPILRADGSLLDEPGYDAATGIIYQPSAEFRAVPAKPSRDDARSAAEILFEAVADFPFASAAHRAAWLAGLLTPLARFAFAGPSPMFLVDANSPGVGKGLLVDTIGVMLTGDDMARTPYAHNDAEMRKRITAIARAGEPLILVDNVAGAFGCPALDVVLTTTRWSDRLLGASEMTGSMTMQAVWYATANNVAIIGDTSRRICHVRLETDLENPEERDDFRHPDLKAWLRRNRPRLVVAALTILRGYFAAGRPNMRLKAWGSYEDWSTVVRNAIAWIGQPDPAQTRRELASRCDREIAAQAVLIAGIDELDPDGQGVMVSEILDAVADKGTAQQFKALRSAVLDLLPAKDGKLPSSRSLAMKLHHMRQRIIGGKYLDSRPGPRGTLLWVVEAAAEKRGTSGTSGTKNHTYARAPTHAHTRDSDRAPSSPSTPASTAQADDWAEIALDPGEKAIA